MYLQSRKYLQSHILELLYPIEGFLNALHRFKVNGNDFRLKFIGTVAAKQKELILSFPECSFAEFINYADHISALRYMAESTALLLIIPDHKSNKSIITGKLFEYIAAGKPVICLGPADGDAAEILRETGHGSTFSYLDSIAILNYLSDLASGKTITEKRHPEVYSRRELTRKVISVLQMP